MGFLKKLGDNIPKPKIPEIPEVKGLDPEIIEKIKETIESVSTNMAEEDMTFEEAIEDEIKGNIHEKVMEQIEPQLENEILKKLAEKAVEKRKGASVSRVSGVVSGKYTHDPGNLHVDCGACEGYVL